ncbi:MAG: hypothetical protein U0228_15465 [Myxococcaceae bacterium]
MSTSRPGVIELSLGGRGPKKAFVFDPHRLALPCWAEAGGPSMLITFDRHFDTVPPRARTPRGLSNDELDRHAREQLDARNFDHIPAAMQAGVITDALIIARARPPGALTADFEDHALITASTLDVVTAEWGTDHASPEGKRVAAALARAERVVLDFDLDCFTTPSDADPTTVVPWTLELIRDFVQPRGSAPFWDAVLARCVLMTFAREPGHCGGLVASGRLFEAAAQAIFVELLRGDLP